VLGVMDTQRLPQVPDAPTFQEQGDGMVATFGTRSPFQPAHRRIRSIA